MRVRTFLFLSSVYCATVSVLDVCDMCFNFLTVYFSLSQKKKRCFWKTNLDCEIATLTTFPTSWHFASWKTGIIHENEMTLVRQQFLPWLHTRHAFSLMPLFPTTYSFCAKFCTYITHCCRCTIILYKMYHTVIVPSLFYDFPFKSHFLETNRSREPSVLLRDQLSRLKVHWDTFFCVQVLIYLLILFVQSQ